MAESHAPVWTRPHLLGLEGLSADELRALLQAAHGFEGVSTRSVKKVPALRGKVVANLFFEDSTRTRLSFSLAASRLSADVIDFFGQGSSVSKGETLADTGRNIEAMGVDAMICRHKSSGAAALLANSVECSVINAGDGQHEHPTQALLDIYTIARKLGRTGDPDDNRDDGPIQSPTQDPSRTTPAPETRMPFDLSGLRIAIVGDLLHSRVARSNIHGLRTLGAEVILVGPPTLVPGSLGGLVQAGCQVVHDLDAVLPTVHAVNMLRVQFERLSGPAFPSRREYTAFYGLTSERLKRARPELLVMHPGPMNRGLEIESAVADGPQSVILDQVGHGLAVRMAVLFLCIQANERDQRPPTAAAPTAAPRTTTTEHREGATV